MCGISTNGARVYTIALQQNETNELSVYKLLATVLTPGTKRVNFTLKPPTTGFWAYDLIVQINKICGYY